MEQSPMSDKQQQEVEPFDAGAALREASLWRAVSRQIPEELPDLAAHALASGLDSPALRDLAGTSRRDTGLIDDLFTASLKELGIPDPDESSARRHLARLWLSEIADGRRPPFEGARLLWWEVWNELGRPEELAQFVNLADDWEAHPELRDEVDAEIIEHAATLLAGDLAWLESDE
jgi:hypothetical protein